MPTVRAALRSRLHASRRGGRYLSVGITPPSAAGSNQQNLLKIWSSPRSGPFDCSYAPTMYVAHELDVAMFALVARHAVG